MVAGLPRSCGDLCRVVWLPRSRGDFCKVAGLLQSDDDFCWVVGAPRSHDNSRVQYRSSSGLRPILQKCGATFVGSRSQGHCDPAVNFAGSRGCHDIVTTLWDRCATFAGLRRLPQLSWHDLRGVKEAAAILQPLRRIMVRLLWGHRYCRDPTETSVGSQEVALTFTSFSHASNLPKDNYGK